MRLSGRCDGLHVSDVGTGPSWSALMHVLVAHLSFWLLGQQLCVVQDSLKSEASELM
jgi:hypothetical protein